MYLNSKMWVVFLPNQVFILLPQIKVLKHALLTITCLTLIVTAIYNTNWAYIISAKTIIVTNHDNYVMTNCVGWNNPRNHILGL